MAEPSHVGPPRLGDRTKHGEGEGPSGEDAGGWGAERGRVGAEVQSLPEPSSMMPQAAPLCLSGCQNSHSLCQWPSCQTNRSSEGHMGPLRVDRLTFRVQELALHGDSSEPPRVELTIHNSCSNHCLAFRMFWKGGISISVHWGQRPPALWTTDLCFPALQVFPSGPHRATTWCLL